MKRLKLDIQKFGGVYSVSAQVISQDIINNTSTIRITASSSTTYDTYNMVGDAFINGSYNGGANGSLNAQYIYLNYWDTKSVTWTITVSHRADGTCGTINFNCYHYITNATNGYSSTSITPATIPRASKITDITCIDNQQRTDNIEGTYNVTYTRYSNDFTDNLVIQYLDRSDNSWNTIKTINNYTSGTDFTFTQQELNTLFSYDTTQTMINLKFYLKTYSGQTLIGDGNEQVYTYKIYDNLPIFTNFAFADINATTLALTGDSSINVNNYSNIQITISNQDKAIGQKGATIVKYKVVIGDKTIDIPYSSSASVNGVINNSPLGTYQVYAIDSRSNSTLVSKFATNQIEYTAITRDTNYTATRDNGGIGGNVTISFSGNIWNGDFGDVNNGFTKAFYTLKKTDSQNWVDWEDIGITPTDITPTITNNTYSFTGLIRSDNSDTTWDLESSYDIKIILEDELSSLEFIITLASATPNISLSRNGVGIMCDYDETLGGLLQVGGEKISKTLNVYSTSQTDTYSCNYVNGKTDGIILYDNSSGTTSTVPLSDSIANYDYIEIYYKTNDNNTISSKKIYPISTSNIVCLDFSYDYSGTVYHKTANVQANGTNITFLSNKEFVNFGTNNSGNYIYITRVIGYK